EELDWAPLGLTAETSFLNLMTSRVEPVGEELGALAAARIGAGGGPWAFYCWPGGGPRPTVPSAFQLLAPAARRGRVGLAVRCPACGKVSVNLVTREHVDVPFANDREVGVVEHLFAADADAVVHEFHEELYSASFDARRLALQ